MAEAVDARLVHQRFAQAELRRAKPGAAAQGSLGQVRVAVAGQTEMTSRLSAGGRLWRAPDRLRAQFAVWSGAVSSDPSSAGAPLDWSLGWSLAASLDGWVAPSCDPSPEVVAWGCGSTGRPVAS